MSKTKNQNRFNDNVIPAWVAIAIMIACQPLYASEVQVLECTIFNSLGSLPFESLDTRYTIRRHIEQTDPVEETTTSIWSEGKFEDNGDFEVTVYPFEGTPRTEKSTSTFTTILDGNEIIGDEYLDRAPTMEKTISYEGFTLESMSIQLISDNGSAIHDHRMVPPLIDRDVWDIWDPMCAFRCRRECVVTWQVPNGGIPCAAGSYGHSNGLCKIGSYTGYIASISTEPHDHEHGGGASFTLNAGLNDAWVSTDSALQGMFVTVYPVRKLVFIAWFTFDSEPPPPESVAVFGAADQRWVTAVGGFSGNRAILTAELTSGGNFNTSEPLPVQDSNYGEIIVEFSDCSEGTVSYNFPSTGESGEFSIQRTLPGNAALCEALGTE